MWLAGEIQGQSGFLLPVTSDLPSGCEQAEMSILNPPPKKKKVDLSAQEREIPGKYKFPLLFCLYPQRCFYFFVPFGEAIALPEDLDCNT